MWEENRDVVNSPDHAYRSWHSSQAIRSPWQGFRSLHFAEAPHPSTVEDETQEFFLLSSEMTMKRRRKITIFAETQKITRGWNSEIIISLCNKLVGVYAPLFCFCRLQEKNKDKDDTNGSGSNNRACFFVHIFWTFQNFIFAHAHHGFFICFCASWFCKILPV